jgi:hypothetical protein
VADVYAGTASILARATDIDLGPVLDEVAHEIEAYAVGLAAEHVQSTDYVRSISTAIDRTSPSRRDRLVYSDDPGALAIEYGHTAKTKDGGAGEHVEGQHILGRAAEAARGPQ